MYCLKPFLYKLGETTEVTLHLNICAFEGALSLSDPNRSLKASVQPSETKSSFTIPPVMMDSKLFLLLSCHPGS